MIAARHILLPAALLGALAWAAGARADSHDVSYAPGIDFRLLKTFSIRAGQIASDKPEIDNRLFRQRLEDSIAAALRARGLQQATDGADVIVTYSFGETDVSKVERLAPTRIPPSSGARGFVIPGSGPTPVLSTEGTLVVDLDDAHGALLWRGTWRDQEKSGPRLSRNLSEDARKLLAEFPPKRR